MPEERILIVDDEPYVGTFMAAILEKENYRSVLSLNSGDAVARLEKDAPYDLILSEIMLKGFDRMAMLERVRAICPDTPIVIVSAMHDVNVAIAAMRNGAYDYLLKPFEQEQLLTTVKRAIEHRRVARQRAVEKENLEKLVTARTDLLRAALVDLEQAYDITLEALGDALDLKDAETEGHSRRVTAYTIALARAMDLRGEAIRVVSRGAFLHDIGKMAIPDAILLKPGKLDRHEQAMMRKHCARGYQILKKIPFCRMWRRLYTAIRNAMTAPATRAGLREKRSCSAQEFLPSPTRWMRSLRIVPIAEPAASRMRGKRSFAAPEPNSIRTWSRCSRACPTGSGKTCKPKSRTMHASPRAC